MSDSKGVQLPKILVIDDSEELLLQVKVALRRNFEILTFNGQGSVLQFIEKFRPNLILVDVHMPNIDGFEMIAQINRHPLYDDIPVIGMSGTSNEAIRTQLDHLGAIGFLQKPFDVKTLSDQVDGILKSLNTKVTSSSGKGVWIEVFSIREKKRSLNELIRNAATGNKHLTVLTWNYPTDYLDEDLVQYLRDDRFSFLQIKPSMLPRFPYMQVFSGLVDEIVAVAGIQDKKTELVIDEPMRLFRVNDDEASLTQMVQYLNELKYHAEKTYFLDVRTRDKKVELYSNKLARAFIN